MSPTPRLNTSRISSVEICPACCRRGTAAAVPSVAGIYHRLAVRRQYPHQVAGDAAAGDVRQPVNPVEHRADAPVIAPVHRQERVGHALARVARADRPDSSRIWSKTMRRASV